MTDTEAIPLSESEATGTPAAGEEGFGGAADAAPKSCAARRHALPILVLAAVVVASFGPALPKRLLGEDVEAVRENPGIRSLSNIPRFFRADYWNRPGSDGRRAYRPLVELTLALDHAVWGEGDVGFRLTNLLLHALVALALYAAACQLSRHRVAALLAAVLFAAHPVTAEVVNVVKNRGDLLGTLFCLLSWLAFIGMVEGAHARQAAPGRAAGRQAVSGLRGLVVGVAFFILALFSKEVAITLPILLLIYTAALVPVGWRGWAGAQTLVWWVALWGYLALSLAAIQKFSGAITTGVLPGSPDVLAGLDAGSQAVAAVKTVGVYLSLLLAPVSLSTVHAFHVPTSVETWPVAATLAALGAVLVVCVVLFRRYRMAAFALAWLPITLLPVSNIVVLTGERPIAEHRLYFPAVGFCLLLGAVVGGLARRRIGRRPVFGGGYRVAVAVLVLVAAAYVVRSATRSALWERAVPAAGRDE